MAVTSYDAKLNLLNELGINVSEILESQMEEISGTRNFTDYLVTGIEDKLGLFDQIIFRTFGGGKDLSGDKRFNILFFRKNPLISEIELKKLQKILSSKYKNAHPEKLGQWTDMMYYISNKGTPQKQFKYGSVRVSLTVKKDKRIEMEISKANYLVKWW